MNMRFNISENTWELWKFKANKAVKVAKKNQPRLRADNFMVSRRMEKLLLISPTSLSLMGSPMNTTTFISISVPFLSRSLLNANDNLFFSLYTDVTKVLPSSLRFCLPLARMCSPSLEIDTSMKEL